MCNHQTTDCFDCHADKALALGGHPQVSTTATDVQGWTWKHTARIWGVAIVQGMLVATVALVLLLAVAFFIAQVSLL